MQQEHYKTDKIPRVSEELLYLLKLLNSFPLKVEFSKVPLSRSSKEFKIVKNVTLNAPESISLDAPLGENKSLFGHPDLMYLPHAPDCADASVGAGRQERMKLLQTVFAKSFPFLSLEIQNYICSTDAGFLHIRGVESRYEELFYVAKKLRCLLEIFDEYCLTPTDMCEYGDYPFMTLGSKLYINDKNKFVPKKGLIAKALENLSGVDKLRICEICEKIFYAKQSNMMACSPACANLRRVRKHRLRKSSF